MTSTTLRDITDRDDVYRLVVAFYRHVAMDDLLGPIFEAAHVNWPAHFDKLTDFWSWQLHGERGYEGNPLRAHEPVDARTPFAPEHYQRWLAIFVETVDEFFAGSVADLAKQRAARMAKALRRLLGGEHGAGSDPIEVMFASSPGRTGKP